MKNIKIDFSLVWYYYFLIYQKLFHCTLTWWFVLADLKKAKRFDIDFILIRFAPF